MGRPPEPPPRPHRSFVVRLWFESADDEAPGGEWRGQVREVSGGPTVYFRRVEGVVGALRKLTRGVSDEPGETGWPG